MAETVSKKQQFNLVTLNDGAFLNDLEEELDGLEPSTPFDRIKFPSAGSTSIEIPTGDGDETVPVKTLEGVIVFHHPCNLHWHEDSTSGDGQRPQCTSIDGKTGISDEGMVQTCKTCPYNQFGSDPANPRAKACKNLHRLYILREGSPIPYLLVLPPTSVRNFSDYIYKRITLSGLKCRNVVTRISFEKNTSASGQPYTRAVFTMGSELTEEQRAQTAKMAEIVKQLAKPDVTEDDFVTVAPAPAATGYVEDVVDDDGSLPF